MKNKIFLLICFFSCISQLIAGGTNDNKQKYWVYRERLKNFMFQGSSNGSGLVLGDRVNKELSTGDEPWYLGYYMATLAMEWKLLNDNHQSTAQTEQDLYYAIDAINFKTPTT